MRALGAMGKLGVKKENNMFVKEVMYEIGVEASISRLLR